MITELAIAGGGVRGLAFLGALYELEQQHLLDIKKIAGTSIGAFVAVCIVVGYTIKELIDVLFDYDFNTIKDLDITNFTKTKSILKGYQLNVFFVTIISKKVDNTITMYELFTQTGIHFIAVTCCLTTQNICYIDHISHPDLPVLTAILMSSAIPGLLPPIQYNGSLYIDGGMLNNFPINILSPTAFGITTPSSDHIQEDVNDNSIVDYIKLVVKLIHNNASKHYIEHRENIIYVDTFDVTVTSFNITIDQKFKLIQSGIESAKSFLNKN